MSTSRLEQLQIFFEQDPNDPFNIYALALEYQNSDVEKALELYETLLSKHENYVATYYHAARLYADLEESEKAREIYQKGITISQKLGDTHALGELKKAYEQFLFEEDL